ncbi:MAG: Two-component system sensor histidine kinase [uncultured Blastococcus sp.]|uniref:histidine kinase n=1 Tax=uncultured Blastococcus sp. TaxID=217144 RepID=A0A6J4HC32_9ACTN|nr:MAG: Two-component system sensor histidine kinase [uncultured Blastococcus sp.]
MTSPPVRPTWLREHPFTVDAVLAGVVFLGTVVLPEASYWPQQFLAFVVGTALVAPLAWRRRAPVPAAVVVVAAGLVELFLLEEFLAANVAALVMVYSLAAYAPRRWGLAGLVTALVGAALAGVRFYGAYHSSISFDDPLVASTSIIAIAVVASWALGDLRRARTQRLASLEERAQLLQQERAKDMRLAATAERARIAREMHDVVAHSLSVVIAQADGGRYAGRSDPAAASTALEAIATTGRQALTDMRSLLGVLRESDDQEFAPQPDVAAIPALVQDVRASGLDVDLAVEGEPRPMSAGPQLAAYRIVQESLTNVLKHSGPAGRAWVRLHWRPDALALSVLDDGRGASAAMVVADGHGQGLRGMRERAALNGGRLEAKPRSGGGFGVHATLPYGRPA